MGKNTRAAPLLQHRPANRDRHCAYQRSPGGGGSCAGRPSGRLAGSAGRSGPGTGPSFGCRPQFSGTGCCRYAGDLKFRCPPGGTAGCGGLRPETDAFTLLPGSSQELCYLAGQAVLEPQPLTGGEELKLGAAVAAVRALLRRRIPLVRRCRRAERDRFSSHHRTAQQTAHHPAFGTGELSVRAQRPV